jgi:hypothetical protein
MHTMTPSPRDRGRRGHRSYEEEFVLYLQGVSFKSYRQYALVVC